MGRIIFGVLFGVVGTGILISLGVWQVQRLAWKQSVLAEIETQISAPAVPLPMRVDPETHSRLPVVMNATVAPERLRVLVSQKVVGAGYRIISPAEVGERRILVDRGFIGIGYEIPAPPAGQVEVLGNLHWPDEIDRFTPEPDLEADIWFARDVAAMADALGTEPILVVARSLSPAEDGVSPLPVDTSGIPNHHLQYAVTWFALAVIWVAMTGYFLTRPGRNGEGT